MDYETHTYTNVDREVTEVKFGNFRIIPIRHAPPKLINGERVSDGWQVVRGSAAVMPGAIWFVTHEAALRAVKMFVIVDEDADKFWMLHDLLRDL